MKIQSGENPIRMLYWIRFNHYFDDTDDSGNVAPAEKIIASRKYISVTFLWYFGNVYL